MARELSAILSELNNVYDPQRQVVKQQQDAIDPALQAETKGLEYAKNDAFSQITNQANRRGMFYSGIPIAEEQRYTGGTYLPALANLQGKYAQQRFNLQDTLNKIQQDQYGQAYGIRQKELDTEEQQRQFDAQLAAQREAASRAAGAGMASPSFGLGGRGGSAGGYGMKQKGAGQGFAFVDSYGNPISAATYAAATGIPFRSLLQQMANAGDQGAKTALGFVGDFGRGSTLYDPSKLNGNNIGIYNSLTWGTPYTASLKAGGGGGGGGW